MTWIPYIAGIIGAFTALLGVYAKMNGDMGKLREGIDDIAMKAVTKAVDSERTTYLAMLNEMRGSIAECKRERAEHAIERAQWSERMDAMQHQIDERDLSVSMLTGEVHRQREVLSEVPRLVEKLAMRIARTGHDRTPTPVEMETLRELFTRLNVNPDAAQNVLLAKANP